MGTNGDETAGVTSGGYSLAVHHHRARFVLYGGPDDCPDTSAKFQHRVPKRARVRMPLRVMELQQRPFFRDFLKSRQFRQTVSLPMGTTRTGIVNNSNSETDLLRVSYLRNLTPDLT